jgi:hypothetical protein
MTFSLKAGLIVQFPARRSQHEAICRASSRDPFARPKTAFIYGIRAFL